MNKQKLTKEKVKKVARLAKIRLSEQEISKLQRHLSDIINYVNQMAAVRTDNIAPTVQVSGLKNVYREDTPQKGQPLDQEQALANAPEQKDGYFKVKAVL